MMFVYSRSSYGSIIVPPWPRLAATFQGYISHLEPWEVELMSFMDLKVDPFAMGTTLLQGLKGVSDGSVWLKTRGAFGWT